MYAGPGDGEDATQEALWKLCMSVKETIAGALESLDDANKLDGPGWWLPSRSEMAAELVAETVDKLDEFSRQAFVEYLREMLCIIVERRDVGTEMVGGFAGGE